MRSRLAANAVLNVLAGASGALFAFFVPALLAGRIASVDLSIWSIVLQTAAYVAPFALGIQGVLARQIALHAERSEHAGVHHTMDAAFRVLGLAAALYLLIGCLVALGLGRLYPDIPAERLREAQWTFAVFLVGQASLIPVAALVGYYQGLQRNLSITVNVLGSKVIASIAIVGLSGRYGLIVLAGAATVVICLANAWLYLAYRRSVRERFGRPPAQGGLARGRIRQMLRDCAPISLWALANFVIYGGTSTVASTADFANFPAYAMATAAVLIMMGLHGAAMSPLIPHVAVVHARGGPSAVGATLERASLVSACISTLVLLAYALAGPQVLQALIPERLGAVTAFLLPILLTGNVIRLLGLPYANTLIGLGMQGRILWTPVIEAAITFGAALLLAPQHGLPGVAASIAIGGSFSILVHFTYNMPLTGAMVPVRRMRTILQTLLVLVPGVSVVYLMRVYSPLNQ